MVALRYITVLNFFFKVFLRNEIFLCLLSADPYVRLDKCTNFDNPRLDQRFEVVDEEIVSICSKFARSEFHFHKPLRINAKGASFAVITLIRLRRKFQWLEERL